MVGQDQFQFGRQWPVDASVLVATRWWGRPRSVILTVGHGRPDPHDASTPFGRLQDWLKLELRLFGITRATAYLLAKQGRIRTLSMRRRGHVRGVRLVSVPSVRAYLGTLLAQQAGEEEGGHE